MDLDVTRVALSDSPGRSLPQGCDPDLYTLKMFRAGHATELAKSGKSVGDILQVGEWRSAAFLAYVDEDLVDAAQILDHVLEDSDME